ncbi:MAG: hypothetical protein H7326_04710 [Bdellovibrionaceae bacterium]|nr:hypothetical protein [Pseudobdellovibrionaceae bacterium]
MRSLLLGFVVAALSLMQTGCGNGAATTFDIDSTTENFGQKVLYNNKVDIVMIVDNSTSMQQHQTRLSQQMPNMVAALQALRMDYHIVVITTSVGSGGDGGVFRGSPSILSNATPNLTATLSERVLQGETGKDLERGLESLQTVLSPAYLTTDGAGFLRDDALLAIVELSDEDDSSAVSASTLATFLDKLKPAAQDGRKSWIFNFIGVLDNSSTCRTFNDYSSPGTKQMALADLAGGTKESICSSNLTSAVSNIKARIVQILTDFTLAEKPVVSTISVRVNGVQIPQGATNGWTYLLEGKRHLVRFHGTAVPPADADIRIDYTPAEAR